MKFLNPCDVDEDRLTFPKIMQPKIDGVRGANLNGRFTARTLKEHRNVHTTNLYSQPEYLGFDGELVANEPNHPDLCRSTSSAVSTITGTPFTLLYAFDYLTAETIILPYYQRLNALENRLFQMWDQNKCGHIRVIPYRTVKCLEEYHEVIEEHLDEGYEGSILRCPQALYREGRCSAVTQHALRVKSFIDFECVVDELIEGKKNGNVPLTNELGLTYRTTHQENMDPNGMIGAMNCTMANDVVYRAELLFRKGDKIKVSAGSMTHDQRKHLFENPSLILNHIITAKLFPRGIKDKPRFPTFKAIRSKEDAG